MWILEHDGSLLDGKKLWLPPGRTFLFGRTSNRGDESRVFHIQEKSVSRQHLIIRIEAWSGDNRARTPSKLSIVDNSSKGTFLDGKQVKKGDEVLLKGQRHTLKLGNWTEKLVLSWQDVCFMWKPASKQSKDSYEDQVRRFRQVDISIFPEYVVGVTSHVITEKRNVPGGLQALINAKYMATTGYMDAVWAVTQSEGMSDDGETPLPSPLELDYDAHWPDPMLYVPPPGKEPTPRPSELFAPDPRRLEVFKGFTFVFADQKQHDSLMPPLTNGHGKAILKEVELGITTVDEYANEVRKLSEWKGRPTGRFEDGQHAGVTVVRFRGKGDTEEWATTFLQSLDQVLGQRSAEQNEFLDAIVTNDTRQLRRPLPDTEHSEDQARPITQNASDSQTGIDDAQKTADTSAATGQEAELVADTKATTASRTTRRRAAYQAPKAKMNFDDFDDDFIPKRSPSPALDISAVEETQRPPTSAQPHPDEESQGMFVPDSPPATSHKRKASTDLAEETNQKRATRRVEHLDKLLPGAAAMKKRRLAQEAAGIRQPSPLQADKPSPQPRAKTKKELDVRAAVRQHAEAIDRRHARSGRVDFDANDGEESDDSNTKIDEDVAKLRDLCIIEDMQVREPTNPRDQSTIRSDRWKPEWEGRKNFKGFRRRGGHDTAGQAADKVIVQLVEVRKKAFSVDDDYFLEDESTQRHQQRSGTSGKNSSESATRSQTVRTGNERGSGNVDEDGDQSDDGVDWADMTDQPARSISQGQQSRKRPASGDAPQGPAAKKTRQSHLRREEEDEDDDDSSDEDDMKFRFRSRRK